MINWGPVHGTEVIRPSTAASLLEKAIAARPADAALRLKLANLRLDRFDFAGAAAALEDALRLDANLRGARSRLGRCYNYLGRPEDALAVLAPQGLGEYERGIAFARLDRLDEAEAEFKALLAAQPRHARALRQLDKAMRRQGRLPELLDLCEALSATGVGHSQLLHSWGAALALVGRQEEARALLPSPQRILDLPLPVPQGFCDISAFNEALSEELLGNPFRLNEFPQEDEANRGSSRVHALNCGRRPELVGALLDSIQELVAIHRQQRCGAFDPWVDSRPGSAHLKAWGLIQQGDDYEEWHFHPGGWLSGVYYVKVPPCVTAAGAGPGCIEYDAPPYVARAVPRQSTSWRHAPVAGRLLLAPSHYAHRTIPTGAQDYRISLAFDVVPDAP